MVSSAHAVCAKGLFIAMISTTVETTNPELEIKPALELLGDVLEMFVQVSPLFEPTDDGKQSNVITYLINHDSFSSPRVMTPLPTSKWPLTRSWRSTPESLARSWT